MTPDRIPALGSLAPLRTDDMVPSPLVQILPPLSERPSLNESSELVLEESIEENEMLELIEGFREEVQESRDRYGEKKRIVATVHSYLQGEDPAPPPDGYEQSTFFYRRLPRLITIGKTKIHKHICPLSGRPFHLEASTVTPGDEEQRQIALAKLRKEIDDIHDTIDLDDRLDDLCDFAATDGTAIFYGPCTLSQPHLVAAGGSAKAIQSDDMKKPFWKSYRMLDVFPDASASDVQEADFFHFRHKWSPHRMRSLKRDASFNQEQLALLLTDFPDGNWSEDAEEWDEQPSNPRRFIVWMRIGFLEAEALELLQAEGLLGEKIPTDDEKRAMLDSLWEVWYCGTRIIKAARRVFQEEQMPVYCVPFYRDPNGLFGIGIGEACIDIQNMLINIVRSIDDDLADTSGFQTVVDAGAVMNKDMTGRGRKTWISRKSGKDEGRGKPVEFFRPPSNLQHLIQCFQLFEAMIPVCSGVPEMTTGLDMGSGVRTNMMHNDIWSALEDFLKAVVGNADRFFWKVFLRDTYHWITTYHPRKEELTVDPMIKVSGVRGALKREIAGKKAQEFIIAMKQNNDSSWINEPEIMPTVIEGLGLDGTKGVLTPQQYVERKALELAEQQKRAEVTPEMMLAKERAHMSARDVMANAYRSTQPQNPIFLAIAEQLFETTGTSSPRAQAALSVWAKTIAAYYQQLGLATPEEAAALGAPFTVESPLELEPGARDEAAAAAASSAGAGRAVQGTEAAPAIPMETLQALMGQGPSGLPAASPAAPGPGYGA